MGYLNCGEGLVLDGGRGPRDAPRGPALALVAEAKSLRSWLLNNLDVRRLLHLEEAILKMVSSSMLSL